MRGVFGKPRGVKGTRKATSISVITVLMTQTTRPLSSQNMVTTWAYYEYPKTYSPNPTPNPTNLVVEAAVHGLLSFLTSLLLTLVAQVAKGAHGTVCLGWSWRLQGLGHTV